MTNEKIEKKLGDIKKIAMLTGRFREEDWLLTTATLLLKENMFFREEFENTLAQIEVPGTSDDFYDKHDYVGEIVLMMRKTLRKADEIREPHA